jgi:NAD(P)-dependent dehydrogenase (short-subunit alcohol dehydrogenase family)
VAAGTRPVEDEVVLITGATSGLGQALASALTAKGATVLLHGRDQVRGQAVVAALRQATGNDRVAFYGADLASLAAVHRLAERVMAEQERLTVLVNNAGVGRGEAGSPRQLSADGYELRFGVNYLAPVLLTRLLIPLLVSSAPARVVNVASATQAAVDFADPLLRDGYDGGRAYGQSKLALIMFTVDLAEELADAGVSVNCLHPASRMPTRMTRAAGVASSDSLEAGLKATLRLAVGGEVATVSGRYFDRLREGQCHPQAYDPAARRRLRRLTDDLLHAASDRGGSQLIRDESLVEEVGLATKAAQA